MLDDIKAWRVSRSKRLLREADLCVELVVSPAGFASEERMRVAFLQAGRISWPPYRDGTLRRGKPRAGCLVKT